MKRGLYLLACLALGGCADTLYPSMSAYMQSKKLAEPTIELFPHCQNYGCAVVKNVHLSRADWKAIEKSFGKPARDPAEEREKIARTIGTFEQIVGGLTGTSGDREGSFLKTGDGQLDCVDESTNTMIYMRLLEQKGLIRHHAIGQPQVRYPILSGRGWMHQTAIVTEKKTGKVYAIDSWYEDNGRPAYVVPFDVWQDGWHPRPI